MHAYTPVTTIDEGNLIEGNNAYLNSALGIYASHSNGTRIVTNDARGNGAGAYADFGHGGMWIGEGATLENCWTLKGNTIADNRGFGLCTAGGTGDRYLITSNTIYNNDETGFIPGSNCVFKSNYVMNNGRAPGGVDMESSGVRLFADNTIYDAIIEDNYFQDDQAVITQKYHVWCSRVAGARISLKNNTFKCMTGIEAVKLFGSGAFDIFKGNEGLIASGSDRSWCDENGGTSTGTGAQQTIAHGLRTIPTRVILSESTTGAALPYQSAAADATNIYVTAVLNKTWQWEAKVR
jgi:parallel beta-helix repeat protein